jgi:hypothetical protein
MPISSTTSRTERAHPLRRHARVTRSLAAVAAAFAALATTPAAAQDEDARSKLYAGAGLGVTTFDSDHAGIAYSDTPVGLQLYGGFQARELMALEVELDRYSGIDTGEVLGSGVERLRISAEWSSVTLRGVFSLPLEDVLKRRQKITLFGSIGLSLMKEERSVMELVASREIAATERDDGLAFAAGAVFELPRGLRLRTQMQSIDRSGSSVESIGLAAEFRF